MTADLSRWKKEEAVRKAEVAYITDDQRRSVEFWWDHLCNGLISLPDFRQRAQRGRWQMRRERYWNNVTQEVLRATKWRAVHDRVAELREIQAIRQNTLELVTPRIVDGQKLYRVHPQSYEGMVRALVSLDELAEAKRTTVLQAVEPDLEREIGRPQSQVFTPDEIRSVSRMLLEARRARQQQQQLPAHKGDDDGNGEGEDSGEDNGEGEA